jgi:hypothetical protein
MYWHISTARQPSRCQARATGPLPGENRRPPSLEDDNIRRALVERVRAEIAAGTYDTPERFEAALERLLDELD